MRMRGINRVIFLAFVICINENKVTSLSATSHTKATLSDRLQGAVTAGIKWLLNARNTEWGWGSAEEAPSIIALHLSDQHWFNKSNANAYISVKEMNVDLLAAISVDQNLSNSRWGHGVLGHYITALVATCQDPHQFYGHDLVAKLYAQLEHFREYYDYNKFAYSWALIGICSADGGMKDVYKDALLSDFGNRFSSIDIASMVAMALSCNNSGSKYDTDIHNVISFILSKQRMDGSFGNEYSTGLALQALFATKYRNDHKINRALEYLITLIESKNFQFENVAAATHVLPALSKTSYASVRCRSNIQQIITSTVSSTAASSKIAVTITVEDAYYGNFSQTWNTTGSSGQTLFQILLHLQQHSSFT